MKNVFTKRILNFPLFITVVLKMISLLPGIISAKATKRVNKSFQEKILLATTSVNQCILCARFASEMAFAEGVDKGEVLSILNMELTEKNSCNEYEMMGLLYAQHYAETNGKPSREMNARIYNSYDKKVADDIIIFTKRNHCYNLMGNTFSAFVSRLKGTKAPGSNLLFELFFVIITSPVIGPSWLYVHLKKNAFNFQK